jgi:hypothetical protein
MMRTMYTGQRRYDFLDFNAGLVGKMFKRSAKLVHTLEEANTLFGNEIKIS